MAEARQADPATHLLVDEMILEYLLDNATKALLKDRKAQRSGTPGCCSADLALSMVDAFLTVFNANHPTHHASPPMQFRLRLLRFTTLATRRISHGPLTPPLHSLNDLRRQNRSRATTWSFHRDRTSAIPPRTDPTLHVFNTALPLSEAILSRNRQHVSSVLMVPSNATPFYGLLACPSLLDTLPGFMALSAAYIAMQGSSTVTRMWISLAARYMTQAALEQYLVYGEKGSQALLEAFAWGFDERLVADEDSDQWKTNAMFWAVDADFEGWDNVIGTYLRAFVPESAISLETHLEELALRNPIEDFEDDMMIFLTALRVCPRPPTLAQLETGELEGLSRSETDSLKQRLGFKC